MSKDLFDDSTMSFGEHLEVLRVHLIKAILGLVVGIIVALFFSNYVVYVMEVPVPRALERHYGQKDPAFTATQERLEKMTWWDTVTGLFSSSKPALSPPDDKHAPSGAPAEKTVLARMPVDVIVARLHELDARLPAPVPTDEPRWIEVQIPAGQLAVATLSTGSAPAALTQATTFGPEEAFMIYIKVALVAGLVLSSPWIFWQIWLFVAAGLYPHERKYVRTYLPMSLFLFLGGAFFCFFVVIPYVLDFLFSFNKWLNIVPQIRITEWISFAVVLPVMFGVSFQLPLVMLFLERISIFNVQTYRDKRRISILVMSIISMVLTPSDPVSMMLMLVPLCLLYEFGILLCQMQPPKISPFEAETA